MFTFTPRNIYNHVSSLASWGTPNRTLENRQQAITINASGPWQARTWSMNPYDKPVIFETSDCLEFCYWLNSREFQPSR